METENNPSNYPVCAYCIHCKTIPHCSVYAFCEYWKCMTRLTDSCIIIEYNK